MRSLASRALSWAVLLAALAALAALSACAIRVDKDIEPSEGSLSSPLTLTVGVTHAGSVSGTAGQRDSYYTFFTSDGTRPYTISLVNNDEDVAWYLYSVAGFTVQVKTCDNGTGDEVCTTVSLTGNETYYLQVHNKSESGTAYNLTVN
jgi:hypothetical protein